MSMNATTTRLPDEVFTVVLRDLNAYAAFILDPSPLKGITYDRAQIKSSIPASRSPLPERIEGFAIAWGCLASRERDVLWLYYVTGTSRGDIDIAGRYGVHQQTAYQWRHTALRRLAAKLGLLGEGVEA